MWLRTKNEFGKFLDTLISEHQRDLVGSSVYRDFPIIIVNLTTQLNTLLRQNDKGLSFLQRITVNPTACLRNFELNTHLILSEPLYIALQMAGYQGDAHKVVNHILVPRAQESLRPLAEIAADYAEQDEKFAEAWRRIPSEVADLLHQPAQYTGLASQKARQIANLVEAQL